MVNLETVPFFFFFPHEFTKLSLARAHFSNSQHDLCKTSCVLQDTVSTFPQGFIPVLAGTHFLWA
jgi:hypothetical protein